MSRSLAILGQVPRSCRAHVQLENESREDQSYRIPNTSSKIIGIRPNPVADAISIQPAALATFATDRFQRLPAPPGVRWKNSIGR